MTGNFSLFDETSADAHTAQASSSPEALVETPAYDSPAALLATLKLWSQQGWLRRLDSAFAAFLEEQAPGQPPVVLVAAALCAHMESRGHTCLRIDTLAGEAQQLLSWPPEGAAAMAGLLAQLPRTAGGWLSALQASALVYVDEPGAPPPGQQPLVLRGPRLYLHRYWVYENRVAAQIHARLNGAETVDTERVRRMLDLLFAPASHSAADSGGNEPAAPDWQKIACAVALRGRLSIITGGPGTGKTYTAARLLALLFAVNPQPENLRIALAAPTGKAAARLKQSIDGALKELQTKLGDAIDLEALAGHLPPARTLHSLLGTRPDTRKFSYHAGRPLEVDVLMVDEASMVHLEMMSALLEALPPTARVIFLGDKDQLASVEAGAILGDLCSGAEQGNYCADTQAWALQVAGEQIPAAFFEVAAGHGSALAQHTVMLRESRRFGGPIGQLALAVNRGDVAQAQAVLAPASGQRSAQVVHASSAQAVVELALEGRDGAQQSFRNYLQVLHARPAPGSPVAPWAAEVLQAFDQFRILCAVREGEWGVAGLNLAVERALVQSGQLSKAGEWYEGRPLMVTRNDPAVGVFNGDVGVVLKTPNASDGGRTSSLRAWFMEGTQARSVSVSRLAHVETAFAMTVHKSQGSEFAHTVLVLPREPSRVLTRELVYTGITRAKTAFTLVSGREQAFAQALAQRTQRAGGLEGLLANP